MVTMNDATVLSPGGDFRPLWQAGLASLIAQATAALVIAIREPLARRFRQSPDWPDPL
jgi:hypothetical protein